MTNFIISINSQQIMNSIEKFYYKKNIPKIKIGSLIKLGFLIKEGNKERIQFYQGIIIAKNNAGINKSFTVRKIVQGIGVERIFLLHSPKISSFNLNKISYVRRSKLYYLRNLSGKASRLKEKFSPQKTN